MKITRSKRFHARNTGPNIVSATCLSCETAGCAHKGKREKTRDKRRQPGKRYSRIGKLRRLRGQPQGGWKSSRVVESGRCQGQIQLLTPENTETVITETRETADGGPISLSSLLPSPQESFSFGPPFFIPRFQSLRLFAHVSYLDHFPRFSRVLPPFFPRAFFCVGGKK